MRKYISLIVVVLAFIGCQNNLDEYYVDKNPVASQSILEYLSDDPDYSLFIELLNSSSVKDTINPNYLYTVFAPTNDKLEEAGIASMSPDSIALFMKMHICANPKTTTTFEVSPRLMMFSDKYLDIRSDSISYSADGLRLTETDIRCSDGIIHKIDGVLTPRLTIYDWLLALGDEYSLFVEALVTRSTLEFDRENSVQIGETSMGRPIYDSVFIVVNDILDAANIQDEASLYRFVIPSNDVINTTFIEMSDIYLKHNMPVTAVDSTAWMDWYLKAAAFDYAESGVALFENLDTISDYSVFGLEFRPSTVTMNNPVQLSNGYAYQLTKGHLPLYIPMSKVSMNPYTIRSHYNTSLGSLFGTDYAGYDSWNSFVSSSNSSLVGSGSNQYFYLYFDGPYMDNRLVYRFKSCKEISYYLEEDDEELTYSLEPVNVVPGNYTLSVEIPQHVTRDSLDQVEVYVNDYLVETLTGITEGNYPVGGNTIIGGSSGFYVGDSLDMVEFRVELVAPQVSNPYASEVSYYRRVSIGDFILTPINNY